MPWCPVCKNEYKDGYTLCADCGAELVDFLKDEAEIEKSSENYLADEAELLNEQIEELQMELSAEEIKEELAKKNVKESVKPYVKASERAENYKSSAFALLLVGVIGAAFLILSYLKVIPLNLAANINMLFYIVMGFMFVAFIVMGIKSLSAAKEIANTVDDENELTSRIYSFFSDNYTIDSIDDLAFSNDVESLSDEEKFFPRSKCIREMILSNFGELDEAYLTELTENIYSSIFEK